MALHKTRNDLGEKTRVKMADLLNERLADVSDLSSHVKTAHWNVKGPHFIALHKLFDEIYEALQEHIDAIAERCVQLGGTAKGTLRLAAKASSLTEYPINITRGMDHVEQVANRLAQFAKLVREGIDEAEDVDDMDTSDLFTEISRDIDKWLWFVEAHQQADK